MPEPNEPAAAHSTRTPKAQLAELLSALRQLAHRAFLLSFADLEQPKHRARIIDALKWAEWRAGEARGLIEAAAPVAPPATSTELGDTTA